MTEPPKSERPSDPMLVAYLDGALVPDEHVRIAQLVAEDEELQRRLLFLSRGNRPFKEAFEPLLSQAPMDRLEASLASIDVQPRSGAFSGWKGAAALAAAILIFFAGLAAGRLIAFPGDVREAAQAEHSGEDEDWRQAVAEYLSLYTAETLASIPDDMDLRERELAIVGSKMRLPLTVQKVAIPNATLKRSQVFQYDGKSLGQIAYLDHENGPMALCMVMSASDAAYRVEEREGFNVVYWSRAGHAFMLIGKAPVPRLREFAEDLSGRLAG